MGHRVEILDDGREIEVHLFDTFELAEHYVKVSRGLFFNRQMEHGMSVLKFYSVSTSGLRASIRHAHGYYRASFWDAEKALPLQ